MSSSTTPLLPDEHPTTRQADLLSLKKGQKAIIKGIIPNQKFGVLDFAVTQRLKDLGFLNGTEVTLVGFGFLGRDPIAVKVGNAHFALRQAEAIKVQLDLI